MKLTKNTPQTPLDYRRVKLWCVLVFEGGFWFPLLDYSVEPDGERFPIKTFESVESATLYATADGHRDIHLTPLR